MTWASHVYWLGLLQFIGDVTLENGASIASSYSSKQSLHSFVSKHEWRNHKMVLIVALIALWFQYIKLSLPHRYQMCLSLTVRRCALTMGRGTKRKGQMRIGMKGMKNRFTDTTGHVIKVNMLTGYKLSRQTSFKCVCTTIYLLLLIALGLLFRSFWFLYVLFAFHFTVWSHFQFKRHTLLNTLFNTSRQQMQRFESFVSQFALHICSCSFFYIPCDSIHSSHSGGPTASSCCTIYRLPCLTQVIDTEHFYTQSSISGHQKSMSNM